MSLDHHILINNDFDTILNDVYKFGNGNQSCEIFVKNFLVTITRKSKYAFEFLKPVVNCIKIYLKFDS